MHTTSELIKITVYRPLDGIRTPYILSLDRQRNVVSEVVDEAELAHIKANPMVLKRHTLVATPAAPVSHAAHLKEQGLYKHITDAGVVISRQPPDQWEVSFEEWLDKDKPNPFPYSEDLRFEYFDELDDIQARIAEGTCPGCELIKMQVSFRIRLREMLDA
jgi:hypothetical protein